MQVQAIIFDKNNTSTSTTQKCRIWLKNHNYKPIKKVHETANFYRYRIREPKKNAVYANKKISKGIDMIFMI